MKMSKINENIYIQWLRATTITAILANTHLLFLLVMLQGGGREVVVVMVGGGVE